jgi:TetR/AcrR family transcriptional regulator
MTSRYGTNRKLEQGITSKERLLIAARELFAVRGYSATSVREIVEAAQVSKPSLYYYFGSKEGIYLELMQSTYTDFRELTDCLTACTGSSRERIINFCTGVFDGFLENIDVARIIYSIYFGPPQETPSFPHEKFFGGMFDTICSIIREGIASGELRNVDELDATWALISSLNSTMEEQFCNTPPRIDRDGLVRMLVLVFDGIGRSDGSASS